MTEHRKYYCSNTMVNLLDQDANIEYQKKDALKIVEIEMGIVHPLELSCTNLREQDEHGGVTDANLKFIDLSATHRVSPPTYSALHPRWYIGAKPDCDLKSIPYVDEEVVFLGPFSKHYGHFILEGLARLWFFLDSEHLKYKAVYIATPGNDRFLDAFYAFGLRKDKLLKITEVTQFKRVIVPEQSFRLQDSYHQKYKETIDQIQKNIVAAPYKKVYFSKEKRNNNRAMGEPLIEDVFRRNGYKVIYPEKISMLRTLSILKGCDSFVASSGTNAHNAIFLKNQSTCICLNRSSHVHYVQTMIDRMNHLNAIYVDVFFSSIPSNWSAGPFLFMPTKYLLHFFRDQGFHFNERRLYKAFPLYLLDFLKTWGDYYRNPARSDQIEDEETRQKVLNFDDLIVHISDDLSHFKIDRGVSRLKGKLSSMKQTKFFQFLKRCRNAWRARNA